MVTDRELVMEFTFFTLMSSFPLGRHNHGSVRNMLFGRDAPLIRSNRYVLKGEDELRTRFLPDLVPGRSRVSIR